VVVESTDGAVEEFADFCTAHRDEVRTLIATRATQTNEIGRCAALLPALSSVAERAGQPLWLLDLGTSAGLNLLFDRYRYEYRAAPPGADTWEAGDPASSVLLRSELRGGEVPPLSLPAIAGRAGVDLRPVDPTDPDQARWLLACQWPDDLERFERQRAALEIAAALPPIVQPAITRGDMVERLPEVAATVPPEAALCVFHSWVAAYLTPEQQAALAAAIARVAEQRPVFWVFAESPFEVPGLPVAPPPADAGEPNRAGTALMLVELSQGSQVAHRLADMHHHGTWLTWWGPAGG
jgi:hypothetical protein